MLCRTFLKEKKKRIRNELNAIIGAKSIVWGSNFVKVEYLRIASAYKKIIKLHKETRVMQMQIWFLFLKLFWLTLRKIVLVITFHIWGWRSRFFKRLTIFEQWEVSTIFETDCFFNLFSEVFQFYCIRTIRIQIGKNNWDLETKRKS